jgi:transposase
MVHPLQCKAIASARLKNDRAGAAILAQLARLRTLLHNRIHAILADHGHGRPAGCRSGPGRAWLASLELPSVSREVTGDGLALTDALQRPTGRLDQEVRQRANADPRVKVLTQLPGAGMFTALVLLAEIGDISRFGSARKLASWAGLTSTMQCRASVAGGGVRVVSGRSRVGLACLRRCSAPVHLLRHGHEPRSRGTPAISPRPEQPAPSSSPC